MTKYQREQITLAISDQLETITEQFIMASQNKGAIPLIEIDLLKESVRTLYQQINDWQSTNETLVTPTNTVEEKTIIVTSPIEEPKTEVIVSEVLFSDAIESVERTETIEAVETKAPVEVVAPATPVAETNNQSEGFLSRMLKSKPAEKTETVAKKEEVVSVTNTVVTEPVAKVETPVAKALVQPTAKPALQVSRTVYPEPEPAGSNRFKGQETIYDRLRQQHSPTVADRLSAKPVGDLRKSIGINERFTLIIDLFGGNQQLFMESIDKINNVNAYEEARKVLYEELAGKLKWNTEGNTFHVLDDLVKRRFNS